MATGAGMIRLVCMDAAGKPCSLVGVATLALHWRHLIRMRILLDAGVAIVALQAAVDAGAKVVGIHADTVPQSILHPCAPMAGEAVRGRLRHSWR